MSVFGIVNSNAPVNGVDKFQMGRYISSIEAVWRILGFEIYEYFSAVFCFCKFINPVRKLKNIIYPLALR